MADSILCIPLKRSSDVNIVTPLKFLIDKTPNCLPSGVSLQESILDLNKLRGQIVAKRGDNFFSQEVLALFHRYHDQILSLEKKIQTDFIVPFAWGDAFNTSKEKYSLPLLSYERICVLFNIAAIQSHLAKGCKLAGIDEELKNAMKYFQSSAGIFNHLKAICMTSPTLCGESSDLNPDTLDALTSLMLTQAQEIFIAKAVKDQMKDQIIAKLTAQAEDMFGESLSLMTKSSIKHIWPKDWLPTVMGKQKGYLGLSQYFQGQTCGVQKQFGEQIARLTYFFECLKIAQEKTQNPSLFSSYTSEAQRLLTLAKKDNDFLYHEKIPQTFELKEVERSSNMRLAKISQIPEWFTTDFKDPFQELGTILAIPTPDQVDSKNQIIKETIPVKPVQESSNSNQPEAPKSTNPFEEDDSEEKSSEENPSLGQILNTSINSISYYYQLSKDYFKSRDNK